MLTKTPETEFNIIAQTLLGWKLLHCMWFARRLTLIFM